MRLNPTYKSPEISGRLKAAIVLMAVMFAWTLHGCQTISGAVNSVFVKIGLPEPVTQLQGVAVQTVPNTLAVITTKGLLRAEAIDADAARQALEVTDGANAALKQRAESIQAAKGALRGPVAVVTDIIRYAQIAADVAQEAKTFVTEANTVLTTAIADGRDLTAEEVVWFFDRYDAAAGEVKDMIQQL